VTFIPRRTARAAAAALLLAVTLVLTGRATTAQQKTASCDVQTTERIVAVGDVHGAFDKFVAILREAGVIDNRRRWAGGRTIFVQTGDIVDRGPDSREALDLLRRLETEAERAGGRVYALVGNHEVMRMLNQRAYVSATEFEKFRSNDADALREAAWGIVVKQAAEQSRKLGQDFDERAFRKLFLQDNPLGGVEMQIAFAATGDYGKWLREHDAMVKINGVVFLHGGISPAVAALGCAAVNAQVRAEMKLPGPPPEPEKALTTGPDGPLWYRGLVDGNPAVGQPEVDAILKQLDARAIVVGHTAAPDYKIRASFDGKVVQIDTGMLGGKFFPGGAPSALEIAGGTFTAIYEGRREVLLPSGK
jgi:predicted MPP superfamily phosphohydrolase